MKKLIALTLAMLMLFSLAACANEAQEEPAPDAEVASSPNETETAAPSQDTPKEITVGISGPIETLNPFAQTSTGGWASIPAYYEKLAATEADQKTYSGQLAKGWEKTGDLQYTVEIYDYITDWNGNKITTDDVIFCYEQAIAAASNATNKIESMEKVDDSHIIFNLTQDLTSTIETILSGVSIVSQKEFEASSDQMALSCVGTGAYIITEFVPSSSMTLERNENYWQTEELTHFRSSHEADKIVLKTIMEDAQMAIALETGTIDVAKIPVASAKRFMDNPDYDAYTANSTAYYVLDFNGSPDSVFYGNKALRQAIMYAINRDEIVVGAYDGYAVPMASVGLPSDTGYQEKWSEEGWYEYDLEKAKELMAEAGYPDGGLTIRMVILANDINKAAATIIQAQLQKIGIELQIEALDNALWFNAWITSDFDILSTNQAQTSMAVNFAANGCSVTNGSDPTTLPYMTELCENEALQAALDQVLYPETCNDETLDAANTALKDAAYTYPTVYPLQYSFARKDAGLAELGYAHNFILVPNTFKFAK